MLLWYKYTALKICSTENSQENMTYEKTDSMKLSQGLFISKIKWRLRAVINKKLLKTSKLLLWTIKHLECNDKNTDVKNTVSWPISLFYQS